MQDNEVTREGRVFYIAFQWVHKYWPHRVGVDSHIVDVPAVFWVDGQPQVLVLSAKIRLYDKAAHMTTSECGVVRPDVGL